MNGKKLIAFALSLCLAGSITACGGSAGTEQKAASDGGSAKTRHRVAVAGRRLVRSGRSADLDHKAERKCNLLQWRTDDGDKGSGIPGEII